MSKELQQAAYKALEEDDPEMVANAAGVLGQFGSAEGEEKLWRRLERWHDEMNNKAADLRKQYSGIPALGAPVLSGQVTIEQALRSAIGNGQSWLAEPDKLKRLRALCLSESCSKDVDNVIGHWNHDIELGPGRAGEYRYSFTVAQYQLTSLEALKQKLQQFPRDTIFVWHSSDSLNDDPLEPQLFSEVKQFLEEHGMKLERATAESTRSNR